MSLRSVCRVKPYKNGFAVEYPTAAYAKYFKSKIAQQIKDSGGVLDVIVQEPRETDNKAYLRLFHAVRDSFAKWHNEPKSLVEKNLIGEFGIKEGIKKRLKLDYGASSEGEIKSLTKYTKAEWIVLIRGTLTEAMEQGIAVEAIAIEFGGRAER